MVGTTKFATDGAAARAVDTTVASTVEVSLAMALAVETRGIPRISTVAGGKTRGNPRKFRDHCRGPPRKRQIMCIPERTATADAITVATPLCTASMTAPFVTRISNVTTRTMSMLHRSFPNGNRSSHAWCIQVQAINRKSI